MILCIRNVFCNRINDRVLNQLIFFRRTFTNFQLSFLHLVTDLFHRITSLKSPMTMAYGLTSISLEYITLSDTSDTCK